MLQPPVFFVAALADVTQPSAEHGEIGRGRVPEDRDYNVRSTDFGNSQAYLLRRLARDAPEVLPFPIRNRLAILCER
jgi:hypothetical protein